MGGVSRKINRDEIIGVLYGKRFGSKIACAKWKEGHVQVASTEKIPRGGP
jgi:hypothetical protein